MKHLVQSIVEGTREVDGRLRLSLDMVFHIYEPIATRKKRKNKFQPYSAKMCRIRWQKSCG